MKLPAQQHDKNIISIYSYTFRITVEIIREKYLQLITLRKDTTPQYHSLIQKNSKSNYWCSQIAIFVLVPDYTLELNESELA